MIPSSPKALTRIGVLLAVRAWIGTPYHHQASLLGVGTDCIGLVRGVWRELYGYEAQSIPGYTRDWAEASGVETLLAAAHRHLVPVSPEAALPADVLVFRFRADTVAKHVGILSAPDRIIHAVEGSAVAEVPLSGWWRRRIAGAFSFPGIAD